MACLLIISRVSVTQWEHIFAVCYGGIYVYGLTKLLVSKFHHWAWKIRFNWIQFWIGVKGLDPAGPMITDSVRLNWRDAKLVHTFQTNAGYYGDMGAIGHLDICVNNGLTQPFCPNNKRKYFELVWKSSLDSIDRVLKFFPVSNLCSHIYALCFMAHSLFNQNHELKAQPCTEACPHLKVFQITKDLLPQHRIWSHRSGNDSTIGSIDNVLLGMNIPKKYLRHLPSIKWRLEKVILYFSLVVSFSHIQCTWFVLLDSSRSPVLPIQWKPHWNAEMLQHRRIPCQRWQTHRTIQIKQQHLLPFMNPNNVTM